MNADCLTYAGSIENLEEAVGDSRHRHEQVDVADPVAVEGLFVQGFDLVVHFAAETHVDRSLEDAGQFVRTNIRGTENILAVSGQRRAGMGRPVTGPLMTSTGCPFMAPAYSYSETPYGNSVEPTRKMAGSWPQETARGIGLFSAMYLPRWMRPCLPGDI